jgi:hypothetical protein
MKQADNTIRQAASHAIFKHDLNITDDLFIINADELDALCNEIVHEMREAEKP